MIIGHQYTAKLPLKTILAGEQQNPPVSVCQTVSRNATVRAVRILPYFRVPKIKLTSTDGKLCRVKYRIFFILFIVNSVSNGKALCLDITNRIIFLTLLDNTGVHQQLPAVGKRQRTSRKAPVSVVRLVRRQRCREMFPVEQIAAHRMSPVHRSPFGLIGIILVKHMVHSIVIRKSIRVIHPPNPRAQMKIRAFLPRNTFFNSLLILARLAQCLACHKIPPPSITIS